MKNKINVVIFTMFAFTIVSITLLIIVRGDVAGESLTENENSSAVFAEPALTLVYFGFIYAVAYRLYLHRKLIFRKQNEKYGDIIKETYKKYRRALLFSHSMINIVATTLGTLHGLMNLDREWITQYFTGFIALVSMIILSISGIIIYLRNNPFWTNKNSRKIV